MHLLESHEGLCSNSSADDNISTLTGGLIDKLSSFISNVPLPSWFLILMHSYLVLYRLSAGITVLRCLKRHGVIVLFFSLQAAKPNCLKP